MGLFDIFSQSADQKAQIMVDSTQVGPGDWQIVTDGGWGSASRGISSQANDAYFDFVRLAELELSQLYDYYWLARKVVRCLPEDAWQDQIVFAQDADRDAWEGLNHIEGDEDGAFLKAEFMSRLHGASLLVKGFRFSGSSESPAPEGKRPEFLEVVRSEDYAVSTEDLFQDPNDPENFGRPEFYRIQGNHRWAGLRLHHSRVVHFPGPAPAEPTHARSEMELKNMSVLDPVHDTIQAYGLSWQSVNSMLSQASVPIWKFPNLIDALAKDKSNVLARHALMNASLSAQKSIMLDRDEEYRRESVGFADVPQILQQVSLQLAAAADIPVTKLFGRIVSGLGDTGNVEDSQWNDQVESYRTRKLAPRVTAIMGPDVEWAFKPLAPQTALEEAQVVKAYWDMGAVQDEEVRAKAEDALTLEELTEEQLAEQAAEKERALQMQEAAAQAAKEDDGDEEEPDETASAKASEPEDEEEANPDKG